MDVLMTSWDLILTIGLVIASLIIIKYVFSNSKEKKKKDITDAKIVIQSLHVYPVKSCAGFSVNKWALSKYGMKYDREWMIYTPHNKRFVTQWDVHKICLIKPEVIINDDNTLFGIKLSAPKMNTILVPINNENIVRNKLSDIVLFDEKVDGIDQGDNVSSWLTLYLRDDNYKKDRTYRLMRISSTYHRDACKTLHVTPSHLIGKATSSYQNEAPFLIASQSSLNQVNNRLKDKNLNQVSMNRFRPNFVIKSDSKIPFIEDKVSKFILNNETTIHLVDRASRCPVLTINQKTAIKSVDVEPFKTLKQFRTGKHLGLDDDKAENVFFGVWGIHDNSDDVVLAKGDMLDAYFK